MLYLLGKEKNPCNGTVMDIKEGSVKTNKHCHRDRTVDKAGSQGIFRP